MELYLHPSVPSWHGQGQLYFYGGAHESWQNCVLFGYLMSVVKQFLLLECLLSCSIVNILKSKSYFLYHQL